MMNLMKKFSFLVALIVGSLHLSASQSLAEWEEFPQLFTNDKKHTYFNVKHGYRRGSGKVKELQVLDEIDCTYQCAVMKEECVAVNLQQSTPGNELRLCEIFKDKAKDTDLILDDQFTYISIEVRWR